ncbi:uncharacterized protein LOC127447906 isoform X1 [Myxocyprinus asiaticus]|uniref:uncharacterized protein LOC127447906 isoform X1 n=1 Tax=Myxocyprinus asiaticus TaxID=70543 RepID=UPI002222BC9D|nr:uncharacterized protein LOC127447906 isoform X1 [Myxocyprinus asiaticus]
MSTCTLLLVSQAGCGLNESLQPCDSSLQTRISCSCRLCGESKHMGECLECFPYSDLCQSFGEGKSFVQSNITKYLESAAFFISEPSEVNMPAELCFGHSEVSGQGDPKKESQSLEHATELCTEQETPIDSCVHQKFIGLNEADGLCSENGQIDGEFSDQHDQAGSSGYSSLLDSCSEHSESFEVRSSVDLVEMSQSDELSIAFEPNDQSEISEHDAEELTLSELSLDPCESFQQDYLEQSTLSDMSTDPCDSCQQADPEQLTLSDMSPDLGESFQQEDPEQLTSSKMIPYLCESFQQDYPEWLNLSEMNQDLCDPFHQVLLESSQIDPSDHETHSECDSEYQESTEQYSGFEEEGAIILSGLYNLSDQNSVVELDSEDCETSKKSKPNNQNNPSECHSIHFESPELCQVSKESMPFDHCVSLEQTRLSGQTDTTVERAFLNNPECFAELLKSTDCSRTFNVLTDGTSVGSPPCYQLSGDSTVCVKALEQCTGCGMYFEKCAELCSPDHSESPHQSKLAEKCHEMCYSLRTQCSVFRNSELPKEDLPNNSTRTEVRKPSECDAIFSGSMENFESRWLSQFLTDLLRHNQESDLSAEHSKSKEVFETPEVGADFKPEVQDLDNCRKLCKMCEECYKGGYCNNESPQPFHLGGDEDNILELYSNVEISMDEVTKVEGSSDESSEEDYADCIDGKSQGSSETDESFKSCVDESESFEIFLDEGCEKEKHFGLLTEDETSVQTQHSHEYPDEGDDKTFDTYTQKVLDASDEEHVIVFEQQVIGEESNKTYAEALSVGFAIKPSQIHEPKQDEVCETQACGPNFIVESSTLYSEEGKGNEPCPKNGEVIEPNGNMHVQMTWVGAGGTEAVVENAFECFLGVDTLESLDEKHTLLENEVDQNLTELYRSENKEIIEELGSVFGIYENQTEDILFETEGAHGPCCGEIETTEDEETSIFDFEDFVTCAEENNDGRETPNACQQLLSISYVFEEQSNTAIDTLDICEPVCQQETSEAHSEPKNISELPHPPGTDGLSEQKMQNEKLEQLIHQVAIREAPEQCEQEGYFKSEQKKTDSEQSDEDSEVSDDEEYPEICDCEFCVPPIDQVPAKPLLPQIKSKDVGKICVVIDLDETLVHSSFKPVNNADFIIPVEIDGTVHQVYVLKRPHVDEFLKRMGELFECVLFTASLAKYADPVSDLLDKWGAFRSRLFRESCVFHRGNYVKDLSRLGRDLNKVIIVDNSPASYIFHPDNAVPVASWFDDMSDTELLDLIPFFERLSKVDNVYTVLKQQRTNS